MAGPRGIPRRTRFLDSWDATGDPLLSPQFRLRLDCWSLLGPSPLPCPPLDRRGLVHPALALYAALALRALGVHQEDAARVVGRWARGMDVLGGAGKVFRRGGGLDVRAGPPRTEVDHGNRAPGVHPSLQGDRGHDTELLPARRPVDCVPAAAVLVPARGGDLQLCPLPNGVGGTGRLGGRRSPSAHLPGPVRLSIPAHSRELRLPPGSNRHREEPGIRSEEHTSELQSRLHLVCRLLLEKKKKKSTHAQAEIIIAVLSHLV